MRYFLILCFFAFNINSLIAQVTPRYSQYILNPFFYNPAFAGREGRYEIHLNHRRQWVGIQDAPVVSSLSFHTGFRNGMAVGLNVYNFSRGLISTNSAQLAVGYEASFGLYHSLRFGLSGGFSQTGLDYQRVNNPNDPALHAANFGKMFSDGKFGFNYQIQGFNVGFTLPQIFYRNPAALANDENSTLNPFRSYLVHADYRWPLREDRLVFHPYFLYRTEPDQPTQWEGGGMLYFQKKFHIGSSYRQAYGFSAMTGFSLNHYLSLGYAYEFAPKVVEKIGQGSHEIQLSVRFGKTKSRNLLTDKEQQEVLPEAPPPTDTLYQEPEKSQVLEPEETKLIEQEEIQVIESETIQEDLEPAPEPARTSFVRGNHPDELPLGYFVIVGVYSKKANADQVIQQLKAKGHTPSTGFSSQSQYYYIFISHTDNITECRKIRDQYRQTSLFQDAWMLEMKE